MDLSKVKLVVTDMDGTLLNSDHEVSPLFFELFEQLRSKGILFAAASGRQHDSIVEKLDTIKEDLIIIAENGGFATHDGKEIVSTPLEAHLKNDILKALEPVENAHAVLCGKNSAYIKASEANFAHYLKEYYTQFELVENLYDFEQEIMKIAVFHAKSSETYIYPAVKHLEQHLKVKVSGENWVDLSHKNAHKGYALEKVMQQLGVSSEETMVFGDYNNDLEMLSMAKYSFAMANAHPNVLRVAKYKTKSNDDYGVEEVLKQLLASKT